MTKRTNQIDPKTGLAIGDEWRLGVTCDADANAEMSGISARVMKPKRGGKNVHKEVKQQVRGVHWGVRTSESNHLQRKEAWERSSAGAAVGETSSVKSKDGVGRGGRSREDNAAAGGGRSQPAVEEMHPSWAARVKQQEAIKVTVRSAQHTLLPFPSAYTAVFFELSLPPTPPSPPSPCVLGQSSGVGHCPCTHQIRRMML